MEGGGDDDDRADRGSTVDRGGCDGERASGFVVEKSVEGLQSVACGEEGRVEGICSATGNEDKGERMADTAVDDVVDGAVARAKDDGGVTIDARRDVIVRE